MSFVEPHEQHAVDFLSGMQQFFSSQPLRSGSPGKFRDGL